MKAPAPASKTTLCIYDLDLGSLHWYATAPGEQERLVAFPAESSGAASAWSSAARGRSYEYAPNDDAEVSAGAGLCWVPMARAWGVATCWVPAFAAIPT